MTLCSKRRLELAAAALAFLCACSSASTGSRPNQLPAFDNPSAAACSSGQAAQFDFWVGSWNGTWTDNQGAATATDVVSKNGCEIDETFRPDSWIWEYDSSTDGANWAALLVVSYKRA